MSKIKYYILIYLNFNFIKIYFNSKMYFPITKPVTPVPDLKSYDPEDYYEIPKMIDPV